jgi:hypothetical protein
MPEIGQQMGQLADGVAVALLQGEQLGELADGDEDGQPEDEPLHHRTRQELGDEAEPQQAGGQEQDTGQDDEPGRQRGVGGRVLGVQRGDGGEHQGGRGRGAGHHQLPAAAEGRVQRQGGEQGVQAGLGGSPARLA